MRWKPAPVWSYDVEAKTSQGARTTSGMVVARTAPGAARKAVEEAATLFRVKRNDVASVTVRRTY